MEKKKIAYVSSEWFFDTDMTILRQLSKNNVVYWFMTYDDRNPRVSVSYMESYAQNYNIKFYPIVCYKGLSPYALFLSIKRALIIKKINPDIVVKVGQDYWTLVDKFLLNTPNVSCIHDVLLHSGKHRKVKQLLCNYSIRLNSNFIVFSNSQYEVFKSYYPKKEVFRIPMSIKDMGKSKLSAPPVKDGIKLLFFGYIEYYKGLDLLIKALEDLYEKGNNRISLTICGSGKEWISCEKYIRHKSLYNLQIRYIDNSEIADLFCSHHFLVLPYRNATQSGPIMLAANYHLPILASRQASFMEVYNDKTAIYYENLTKTLYDISLMTQPKYDAIKEEAAKISSIFSEEAVCNKFEKVLENCINAK